jgi:hypothetical protein
VNEHGHLWCRTLRNSLSAPSEDTLAARPIDITKFIVIMYEAVPITMSVSRFKQDILTDC